jgi:hypothetical protein
LEIIVIEDELVTHLGLGVLEVVSGVNNVAVKLWTIVVQDLLGWVDGWLLHLEVPLVSDDSFGNLQGVVIGNNVVVHSIVWNWIVNWVWQLLVSVLELSATS